MVQRISLKNRLQESSVKRRFLLLSQLLILIHPMTNYSLKTALIKLISKMTLRLNLLETNLASRESRESLLRVKRTSKHRSLNRKLIVPYKCDQEIMIQVQKRKESSFNEIE